MALNKQNLDISFAQGLDLKTDPFRVSAGKFLSLQNTIFTKSGLMQKRNGYRSLTALPDNSFSYATTFNGNLTAIGNSLAAYSSGSNSWVSRGSIQPVELDTLPLIRSNTNQTTCDAVISTSGLVCTAYTDQDPADVTTKIYRYAIADSVTGQNLVSPTTLTATGAPKVFLLGNQFIVVYPNGTALLFVAINASTLVPAAPVTISSTYTANAPFDAFVTNNALYVAWYYSTTPAIKMTFIDSVLSVHTAVSFSGDASAISVTADTTGSSPVIWVSYFYGGSGDGYSFATDLAMEELLAPTKIIDSEQVINITSSANDGVCSFFYQVLNTYSYAVGIRSDYIEANTITFSGVVDSPEIILRSVGLASKAFVIDETVYFLTAYGSVYQPTYFLSDSLGNLCLKLAYSNGGGYLSALLPNATAFDNKVFIPYLIKDLIVPVNKARGAPASAATFSQTGINLAAVTFTAASLNTSEIGADLNLTGGFLWMYDGYTPVEQNFHLWPDDILLTGSTSGGDMLAQEYFYVSTYEWSDNQGNLFRSAPSIPLSVTTTGSSSSVTVDVPTLRLTYKIANPVKIVLYRWSTGQQTFYQVTSVSDPLLNDTSVDSVEFLDTQPDSDIIGNSILYTTGGVVENIGPPATSAVTLYKSRLFLIDSEDKNLLWFSKQVIEAVPVEMSDLLTMYIAPTVSSEGSTGPMRALGALDDKLIIFKRDAIYYITGTGPDNTGANNDFSDPIFITSTVGCANQNSIAFIPDGLMFQSDKGIWLLGRDLSTKYIGAPVEAYNQYTVLSAVTVPGTNQVRFTLSNGITLMYDYFYGQWGTFANVPAISSTLYQGLHTYINAQGKVFQESSGSYLDGSSPVLISFTTSWLNLAGLQGYERAYFFYLLGTYLSPHKLTVQIAYDYNPSPSQTSIISPDNYNGPYGSDPLYGNSNPYGGTPVLEQWQVYLQRQLCQAMQITVTESFDSFFGTQAGAGLTLSGINLVLGMKKSYRPIRAANSVG